MGHLDAPVRPCELIHDPWGSQVSDLNKKYQEGFKYHLKSGESRFSQSTLWAALSNVQYGIYRIKSVQYKIEYLCNQSK